MMRKAAVFGPAEVGVAGRVLIAVDPTGPRVAVLVNAAKPADPHTLERWDLTNPQAPVRLDRAELRVSYLFDGLAFLGSGKGLAVASARGMCRWSFGPTLDQPLGNRALRGVTRIATDGRLVGLMGEGISLWSPDGTTCESIIDVSNKYGLTQLAVSPDGRTAAMASSEPYVRIVDLVNGKQTKRIACKGASATQSMDFSADGSLLVHGPMTADLIVRETRKWSEVRKLGPDSAFVNSIAFAPTGTRVVVSSTVFTRSVPFAIYDAATSDKVAVGDIGEMSWQAAWLDDEHVLVAGASGRVHTFAL